MRELFKWIAGTVLLGALLVAGVTYSWTYTPLGRLDYAAAIIAKLMSWQRGPLELTPEARAEANARTARMFMSDEDVAMRTENRTIESPDGHPVPIRIYWPEAKGPLPLYLDIHGGGWWMGNGYIFEPRTKALAAAAETIIVSVDYRLAPEHPYPTPLDDCHAALLWMHRSARELGGDPDRIAIGGGSAGGNLAAALALRLRDEGGPRLLFQSLMIPATDLSGTQSWPSFEQTGDRYMLTVSGLKQMYDAYVPDRRTRLSPYVSPLLAQSHAGLPPALVITAHFDPLRDEGVAYAKKLEAAGVPVELVQERGLHGFAGSPDRMARVGDHIARALRAALHGDGR
jgi:acetyl esterase